MQRGSCKRILSLYGIQHFGKQAVALFKLCNGGHDLFIGAGLPHSVQLTCQLGKFVGMGCIMSDHIAHQGDQLLAGRATVLMIVVMAMIVAVTVIVVMVMMLMIVIMMAVIVIMVMMLMVMRMLVIVNVLVGMGVGMLMIVLVVMSVTMGMVVICAVGMGMGVGMFVNVGFGMSVVFVLVMHKAFLLFMSMIGTHQSARIVWKRLSFLSDSHYSMRRSCAASPIGGCRRNENSRSAPRGTNRKFRNYPMLKKAPAKQVRRSFLRVKKVFLTLAMKI